MKRIGTAPRRVAGRRPAVALLVAVVALAAAAAASAATETTVELSASTLPYPIATILTNQLESQYGIVFSADDSDLPPAYQLSLGDQENVIREGGALEERELINPFRIFFTDHAVTSVSLTLVDRNSNDQTHALTAFSGAGRVLDSATFRDGVSGGVAGTFTLTVSSNAPIAYVVEIEQPFGAEVLRELRYTSRGR